MPRRAPTKIRLHWGFIGSFLSLLLSYERMSHKKAHGTFSFCLELYDLSISYRINEQHTLYILFIIKIITFYLGKLSLLDSNILAKHNNSVRCRCFKEVTKDLMKNHSPYSCRMQTERCCRTSPRPDIKLK